MTKSTQGVYLRRLQAQRHRSSQLKEIGNFKIENINPKFTLRHAAWKEENIAKLKKEKVYPKFTQAHTGHKSRFPPSFTEQGHMNWRKHQKKSYLDKIAYAEGRSKKEQT